MKSKIVVFLCFAFIAVSLLGGPKESLPVKYFFTDELAEIPCKAPDGEAEYELKTITRGGWGPSENGKTTVKDGKIQLKPLAEGIHVLTLKNDAKSDIRFLVIAPPPKLDPDVLRRCLPRAADKILKGEPIKILAMGDSVTNTGDFENMLAAMLSRTTGNKNITVVDRSYPGRSIDASVRNFKEDAVALKPDFAMIMYGLNDQICGCSLDGFLEQYEWLAKHLADECGSDTVFLQPTPHIDIPVKKDDARPDPNPPEYAFRTVGFAESVKLLADKLKIPCAETFNAVWGDGGATIEESAIKMWPLYPPSYSKQFSSMIETDGKGDTIHPNALGHLMIAKAVYNSIACMKTSELLEMKAVSAWMDSGVNSKVAMTNRSGKNMTGRLAVYPRLECEPVVLQGSGEYNLKPGESAEFKIDWPKALKPEDLLKYPANTCLAPGNPIISTLIFSEGKTHAFGIPAPFGTSTFIRERMVAENPKVQVRLDNGDKVEVDFPANQDNGRIPLIRKVDNGWAVAELAFCRYSSALKGEAVVDGEDKEWTENKFSVVGEPCQARWVKGADDKRASPDECMLKWSSRAGWQGLFIAIRANGSVESDNFTMFFDTRKPELLGTPGPYYWVSGSKDKAGAFKVSKGETSKKATGLAVKWSKTDYGAFIEMFIPYELMEMASWPESGDLGFSLWWNHKGPNGVTHLMWSEDGHPWNTRWYGVIRLENQPGKSMPWMVRVK
ncbi:MAG TPA: hypothetical protein DET40_23395 [Lentisphaeria bacterium]|nr:MAG: hypothetical protein A2X45_24530 [Lentisphaerae bacterium GWF2_50_93]HCE46501.1 hypothetical protein [Lentisphaeria bacterium]